MLLKAVFIILLHLLLLCGDVVTAQNDIELLVPAYANPANDNGMWDTLTTTAETSTVKVNIILNPFNGPGPPHIDPNYINDNGGGALVDFIQAGGVAYGYVATGFGGRSMADVKADIDTYHNDAYWRGQGIQVSGIFFDEMSNDLNHVGYYNDLRDYVKSVNANHKVISNPGTSFTNNPGTYSVADYANSADTIVTFEQTGDMYRNSYVAPSWVNDFSSDHFCHLVHSEALSTISIAQLVSLACSRNAGMLYVTDDLLTPNPWDNLSSYWVDLVAALETSPCGDNDGDGVLNVIDVCPGTTIPDSIPTRRLRRGGWALVDNDTTFDTAGRNRTGLSFSTADTAGCSGEQIIDKLGLGWKHRRFGVSTTKMKQWVARVN